MSGVRASANRQFLTIGRLVIAVIAAVGAAIAATWASATAAVQARTGSARIETVSADPARVSGGNVLVRVTTTGSTTGTVLTLNGRDVSSQLRSGPDGSRIGVVSGMSDGPNVLALRAGANELARLDVVNHPITGPVFAGPKETPFICETAAFKLQSGGTLGPALDANCSAATRVDYVYRPKGGNALKPMSDRTTLPADVDRVTTSTGATVPFVVRIETGTINRGIYQIAMLHDPSREPAPDFATAPAGWNHRLIYTFGGGCMTGWYHQAQTTGGVTDAVMLGRGYAVASSTLNVAGNNCDTVLAAETMMMVKEHFVEAYGLPLFTIGWGCSGGSYQVHEIADVFPGLLDGIITGCSFPDVTQALTTTTTDSRLLGTYFKAAALPFSDEQQRAVSGYVSVANMMDGYRERAARVNAMETCPPVLLPALRYDPKSQRTGARCDIYDHAVNVFGRDPRTGFARRPLDNVGVQYGLAALNAGVITPTQFLDLNENIGGYDEDGVVVAKTRTVADSDAVRIAYRTGRVTSGGGGLSRIPIIDYRVYADESPKGDPHLRYHSFSMRARLIKANGTADNQVMLIEDNRDRQLYDTSSPVLREALAQMDRWLTNLTADRSTAAPIDKIRKARPADLTDACWSRDAARQKIAEPQRLDSGACTKLFPVASYPRGVAGAPIDADIVKCQLKPIDRADYRVALSAEELRKLQAIFPSGVCDWGKPGVDQQRLAQTWPVFGVPRAGTSAR
jgi:hypothetical protein